MVGKDRGRGFQVGHQDRGTQKTAGGFSEPFNQHYRTSCRYKAPGADPDGNEAPEELNDDNETALYAKPVYDRPASPGERDRDGKFRTSSWLNHLDMLSCADAG